MRFNHAQVILATAIPLIVGIGCESSAEKTDLRSQDSGPPNVLAVLVLDDPAGLREHAVFCRTVTTDGVTTQDDKAPTIVGLPDYSNFDVCENGVGLDDNGNPIGTVDGIPGLDNGDGTVSAGWHVRVMFDKLLDPSIETLTMLPNGTSEGHINTTHPVDLLCDGVAVPYDGYYAPNGNAVTWPLGPSILIQPSNYVAAGSTCTVTLTQNITNKLEQPVPTDELGPYKFDVGDLALIGAAPTGDPAVDAAVANVTLSFNGEPVAESFTNFNFTTCDTSTPPVCTPTDVGASVAGDGESLVISGTFAPATNYEFTIPMGSTVDDIGGQVLTFGAPTVDDFQIVDFSTNPVTFEGISPQDGAMVPAAMAQVQLTFNTFMNADLSGGQVQAHALHPTPNHGFSLKHSGGADVSDVIVAVDAMNAAAIDITSDDLTPGDYTFSINNNATITAAGDGSTFTFDDTNPPPSPVSFTITAN